MIYLVGDSNRICDKTLVIYENAYAALEPKMWYSGQPWQIFALLLLY